MKKKLFTLGMLLAICLSVAIGCSEQGSKGSSSSSKKATWTVTCPWAASGVASVVSQKAASLSTTFSQNIVLVAEAIPGDTATMNSWIKSNTADSDSLIFIGEGVLAITKNLSPEKVQFSYDDFVFVQNLYSSVFVMSANSKLNIKNFDELKSYLAKASKVRVAANGSVGSEAFLAAALFGSMGYANKLEIVPYTSAAESAQAVSRGETDLAISHQSQILESYQQGNVSVVCAFDENNIQGGVFDGVEGVGQYGIPYFKNACGIFARAGADTSTIASLTKLYTDIFADIGFSIWLENTMLLNIDPMTNEDMLQHVKNVSDIVNQYKDVVLIN